MALECEKKILEARIARRKKELTESQSKILALKQRYQEDRDSSGQHIPVWRIPGLENEIITSKVIQDEQKIDKGRLKVINRSLSPKDQSIKRKGG